MECAALVYEENHDDHLDYCFKTDRGKKVPSVVTAVRCTSMSA